MLVLTFSGCCLARLFVPFTVSAGLLSVVLALRSMIVGIATYFEWAWLSVTSIFVLLTVVMMFLIYIAQFDHDVDRHKENTTGVAMIYLHYPIFFGIIMTSMEKSRSLVWTDSCRIDGKPFDFTAI